MGKSLQLAINPAPGLHRSSNNSLQVRIEATNLQAKLVSETSAARYSNCSSGSVADAKPRRTINKWTHGAIAETDGDG